MYVNDVAYFYLFLIIKLLSFRKESSERHTIFQLIIFLIAIFKSTKSSVLSLLKESAITSFSSASISFLAEYNFGLIENAPLLSMIGCSKKPKYAEKARCKFSM